MTLSVQQLEDIRGDVGDEVSRAFEDAEIQRLWDRLSSAPNDNIRLEGVKGFMFERLLNNSTKLHDYTAGAVGERLKQVVDNLEKRFLDYKPALEASRSENRQLVISKVGKRAVAGRILPNDV